MDCQNIAGVRRNYASVFPEPDPIVPPGAPPYEKRDGKTKAVFCRHVILRMKKPPLRPAPNPSAIKSK